MRPQLWVNHQSAARSTPGEPQASLIVPPINRHGGRHKPESRTCFWTSTYGDPHCWINWCHREEWSPPEGAHSFWRLDVAPDANIFHIHNVADLERLIGIYPHKAKLDPFGGVPAIDFEAASLSLDGIHLTGDGEVKTRLAVPNLYGWDCECTLWFRWKFTNVEQVARHQVEAECLV